MEYAIEPIAGRRRFGFTTHRKDYPRVAYREIEVNLWSRMLLISIRVAPHG
jgi:hypothetical protein